MGCVCVCLFGKLLFRGSVIFSCDVSVTVSVTVIFFLVSIEVSVILFQLLLQLQLFSISINCTNNERKCCN